MMIHWNGMKIYQEEKRGVGEEGEKDKEGGGK